MIRLAHSSACLGLALLGGCSANAERRPQILAHIDTDLPVVGQVAGSSRLSFAAAVDTLRIDAIKDGSVYDSLTVVAPDPQDWPVSFGVAAPGTRLRLRVFRGEYAAVADDGALEPLPLLSVERTVDVSPGDGVENIEILLSGDCLGKPASFSRSETCVDESNPSVPFARAFSELGEAEPPATRAGTWPGALEEPCSTEPEPEPERICVPGGFSVLGSERPLGYTDGVLFRLDPYPPRPVRLSPFHLDRHEYTVGRLRRALAAQGQGFAEDLPVVSDPASPNNRYCTFHGLDDDSYDDYPVNCVKRATASALCALDGGTLPSEAQWEHAARGRGQQLAHPWGASPPGCCTAGLERIADQTSCGLGPEKVGSHPRSGDCLGLGDVSIDGVEDLAGNVEERTLDSLMEYDGPCWNEQGVLLDPVCMDETQRAFVTRGSGWSETLAESLLILRRTGSRNDEFPRLGFRCAYPDEAP